MKYVNANLKMSIFAETECHFSAVSIVVYTALIHSLTCWLEARQALIYQLVLGLTGENGKYNYSRAVHLYPPFFDITCSAKNYKIAPALTKYTLIDENGKYALILRGESMTQYAVVSGLDKETGSWNWTCCYYDFGKFSKLTKMEALFKALDYYLMRTNEKHITWARMSEIATILKDGLIEDGEEEAYHYMADVAELSDTEAEYFGLDMEQYRDATGEDADNPTAPSSTGNDYSPAHPWDAPGMSTSDFI